MDNQNQSKLEDIASEIKTCVAGIVFGAGFYCLSYARDADIWNQLTQFVGIYLGGFSFFDLLYQLHLRNSIEK